MTKTIDRPRYALTDWVVEMRNNGWYFTKYHNRQNRAEWHGPYSSESSVALMIARHIRREIETRHTCPGIANTTPANAEPNGGTNGYASATTNAPPAV